MSLTLNANQDASSTLATANQLVSTQAGTTSSGVSTKVGTSSGWGQVYAKGNASAFPALGAIGSPDGNGWLLDNTSLEAQTIIAGNWQWSEKGRVTVGTLTTDMVVRYYKYNAGTYTLICSITLSAQAVGTTQTVYTSASTAESAMAFGTGDKLYKDMWLNITANSTGSSTASFALQTCNNAGAGLSGIAQTTTPGYQPTVTTNAVSVAETATGSEVVTILNMSLANVTETATGSETVTILVQTLSPSTAQMDATDLAFEYNRIMNSVTGSQIQMLATTYYGNTTNSQVIYGELDALLKPETMTQLHVMRSIADVSNFLQATEYECNVLNDSPIVYYRLGEPVGTAYASDISGRKMTGTLFGGVTAGQAGALAVSTDTAMLFNGTSGYIQLPAGVNTANWQYCSIEAWIKFSNVTFSNTVSIVANDTPGTSNLGIQLQATKTSLALIVGFGTFANSVTYTRAFAATTWYHVVAVYSYTNMYIYVNGVQVAVLGANPSTLIAQTTGTMYIAKNPPDILNGFPGVIDEVAIYNTALPSSRVLAHYNAGITP